MNELNAISNAINIVVSLVGGYVWGLPLIFILLGTGVLLTIRLRGLQFTQFFHAMRLAFFQRDHEKNAEGDISHFQALMTALAATVGTGNIVGVATAITMGGPGALFWMWMTGLLGMVTKYTEALLAVHYRQPDTNGRMNGGPMYYLRDGLAEIAQNIKTPGLAKFVRNAGVVLAVLFAIFCVLASFGIGNMTQTNSVAAGLKESLGLAPRITGGILFVATGVVLLGGIKAIGRVTEILVPFMILVYMTGAIVILVIYAAEIPAAFQEIFKGAFGFKAVTGGFAGAALKAALEMGVKRGIFSNESGLGSAPIAAAAARTREPARQALISMTQTFIDTLVVCTCTGLVILVTDAYHPEQVDAAGQPLVKGIEMTMLAFGNGLGHDLGPWIVVLGQVLFAYSTVLGWSYYGERALEYLGGEITIIPYRIVFTLLAGVGAIVSLDLAWGISDIFNGLMAAPNLIGLILLSGVAARLTKKYLNSQKTN